MREILFRGKRCDNGEWVQGDLLHPDLYGNGYAIEDFTREKNNCFDVIPETIGQYTGLTDKNGKKIFEGDIIKCTIIYDIGCYPHFKPEIREVKYIAGCFNPLYDCERNTYEVLGNIHDNPELLEGGVQE